MTYENAQPGIFRSRKSRFIAEIEIDGQIQPCHVNNTGRCRELLLPGARVYVQRAKNPARATQYDLLSVYKGERLVNIDSGAPNRVFHEWATQSGCFGEILRIRPETRFGSSRFDFYIETANRKIFAEVKGVTLESGGVASFPDAPTQRGMRHLRELMACRNAGYHAAVAFIIQMKGVHAFRPADTIHAAFGTALREAAASGVEVLSMDCIVTPGGLCIDAPVPVLLG